MSKYICPWKKCFLAWGLDQVTLSISINCKRFCDKSLLKYTCFHLTWLYLTASARVLFWKGSNPLPLVRMQIFACGACSGHIAKHQFTCVILNFDCFTSTPGRQIFAYTQGKTFFHITSPFKWFARKRENRIAGNWVWVCQRDVCIQKEHAHTERARVKRPSVCD